MMLQASPSPRIAAGRLRDHRGDYFSEGLFVENPYSPSFSGSFTTSFSPVVTRGKAAENGQRTSLLATIPASARTISPNAQVCRSSSVLLDAPGTLRRPLMMKLPHYC